MSIARNRIAGLRLGLLADSHDDLVPWDRALEEIEKELAGVDAILHAGDLCTPAAIEGLRNIAPVYAVRSPVDPPPAPPALVDGPRVLEVGDVAIGLMNDLGADPVGAEVDFELAFPKLAPERVGPEVFGGPVQVVVFGGSHKPCIASAGGILFVNPGSPTLAEQTSVALLTLRGATVTARIVPVASPRG